ncbi:DUF2267 domain-containing protein [Phytohabitans sp. ZYX-F-186]|uniref:DUF2267 domain-containing protein n=1 Tax=Phytohabitans maris TaxID=3071409 RepID=A0ABU0ZM79_9ACTN|nr:DUF2267 domain-containing protein [Phytohabitans sp. ZYX-F-186]MDQ7908144.1 DUF2267 domain-containing protein [Phytohabitans sp. ZYX-F-186]
MELAFIHKVAEWTGTTTDVSEALTEATLSTLTQRISGGEAADLADRVPDELRPYLTKGQEYPEVFPYGEFVRRVGESTGVDLATAEAGIVAVLRALRDVVGYKEFMDTLAQLPDDLASLAAGGTSRR